MKHVLSISLGSSRRDSTAEVELLGERFLLERRGTDGSLERFRRFMIQNDGLVDCLCVGGTNLGLHCGGRYYRFRDIARATRDVKKTPLVDGSGLKNTLERRTLHHLQEQGIVDFATARVLLTCGIDRFGIAEELDAMHAHTVYGDLMFNLGIGLPIRSLRTLQRLGWALLPLLVRTPFKWLYPAGSSQEQIVPKYERWYRWADVIAGDFHFIRRHMPDDLSGKVIITNTITPEDIDELSRRRVRFLITTTPTIDGRNFGTNVLEGIFVCLAGKRPEELTATDYLQLAERLHWRPEVRELTPADQGDPDQ